MIQNYQKNKGVSPTRSISPNTVKTNFIEKNKLKVSRNNSHTNINPKVQNK